MTKFILFKNWYKKTICDKKLHRIIFLDHFEIGRFQGGEHFDNSSHELDNTYNYLLSCVYLLHANLKPIFNL